NHQKWRRDGCAALRKQEPSRLAEVDRQRLCLGLKGALNVCLGTRFWILSKITSRPTGAAWSSCSRLFFARLIPTMPAMVLRSASRIFDCILAIVGEYPVEENRVARDLREFAPFCVV